MVFYKQMMSEANPTEMKVRKIKAEKQFKDSIQTLMQSTT
jgi:hypothetical protein